MAKMRSTREKGEKERDEETGATRGKWVGGKGRRAGADRWEDKIIARERTARRNGRETEMENARDKSGAR